MFSFIGETTSEIRCEPKGSTGRAGLVGEGHRAVALTGTTRLHAS